MGVQHTTLECVMHRSLKLPVVVCDICVHTDRISHA